VFLLGFTAFLLMIGAWSLAAPYDGSPDELDHIVRAVGIVSGDVTPEPAAAKHGSGAFQTVPSGLVRANCWAFQPTRSAACAVPPGADRTPVVAATGAGRYYPAYYAIVGWPLHWWPGWSGVFVARLLSGALAAALLAGALAAIARYSRHRVMAAGLLVAITPMTTYMAGAVNPNGVEIAAGAAFFAAVIPLFLGEPPPGNARPLLVLAGLGGLALAVLRPTGLLLLAVAAVVMLVPWQLANVRRLRARVDAWLWLAAVTAVAVSAVVWMFVMKANDLGDYTGGGVYSRSQAAMAELEYWRLHLDEMVGVFGWLDTRMASTFYVGWQVLAGALLLLALVFGNRIDRWRLAVLAAGGLGVPVALEIVQVNRFGFISQGRYFLAAVAALMLLAGHVLDRRGLPPVPARTLVRLTTVLMLALNLVGLVYTMARWQRGLPPVRELRISSLNPLAGDWHPPAGSVVPLLVQIVGLVTLGVLVWRLSAVPAPVAAGPVDEPGSATEPGERGRPAPPAEQAERIKPTRPAGPARADGHPGPGSGAVRPPREPAPELPSTR